jgi:hypothetical protein
MVAKKIIGMIGKSTLLKGTPDFPLRSFERDGRALLFYFDHSSVFFNGQEIALK